MLELGTTSKVAPWSRVAIMLVSLAGIFLITHYFTGSLLPGDPEEALVFQGALLLIVLGSALLEYKGTRPAESVVNSLMTLVTLVAVYPSAPRDVWWGVFSYALLTFLLSTVCTAVSSGENISGWRQKVASFTYRPSVFLGRARLIYSVLFLFALFSFYEMRSRETVVLLLFWGVFVVIWPLGLPELLSSFRLPKHSQPPVGRLVRIDSPDIIRVALESQTNWSHEFPKMYQQPDGKQRLVVPLFSQVQEYGLLGTGICGKLLKTTVEGLGTGYLYEIESGSPMPEAEVAQQLGGDPTSRLIGFVVEESSIAEIRVETWDPRACREGMVVWCKLGDERVYYQVTEGVTREESFRTDRHGFQVAFAAQLGKLDRNKGFVKHTWLPAMNTPVFAESEGFGQDLEIVKDGDFAFGSIPGTRLKVGGPFLDFMDHHTALLGVTGSGKTELAFDLIRHAVAGGRKVVCIDLTAKYEERLADLCPVDLSISEQLSQELSQKLFDVETGKFGAGDEKKALREFAEKLREEISKSVADFLTSQDEKEKLGLIKLEEISNTTATLHITELYLTCLLHFKRDNPGNSPPVLIVVEEAHTVMPEPSTMGLGDFGSRGLVGKITQIALQGRKYGVGLLVIAQRTATVSKSVLTQCNTVVSFTCFDDTSLGFLANIFGRSHTSLIPNLPPLNAVIFGRAVRSERPIIVEIPYDAEKAKHRP